VKFTRWCRGEIEITLRKNYTGVSIALVRAQRQNISNKGISLPDTAKHQSRVYIEYLTLTEDAKSSAIMHEVHPSLQGDSSLFPQLLSRIPQRSRRSFIVRRTCLLAREKRLVKALG
jgi:hypothetical protein